MRHDLGTALLGALLVAASGHAAAPAPKTPVAVDFRLTDAAYHPLAGVAVRIVFDSDPDWRGADAGRRFVTDANGEAHFVAEIALDRGARKLPSSNPLFNVFGVHRTVDRYTAGVELEDGGAKWLYVVEASSLDGNEGYLDALTAYLADDAGRFVRPVGSRQRHDDPDGVTRWGYGYDVFDYFLGRAAEGAPGPAYTLKLAFKKLPPPPEP